MTAEQWSALLALLAALVITAASFLQWWTVTVDGDLPLRRWARLVFLLVAAFLVGAIVLLLVGVFSA